MRIISLTLLTSMSLAASSYAATTFGSMGGLAPSAGSASAASGQPAKKLQGFYLGGMAAVTHLSAKIDNRSFSGTGASGSLYFGYGWAAKKVYGAAELDVGYGSVNTTKDTNFKLRSTFDVAIGGRFGVVLKETLLPYIRIGLGAHGYNYYENKVRNKFNTFFVAPGLGFEALIGSNFLFRIEANYSIPITLGGISKTKVQQKPKRAFVRLGGAYKF